MALIDKYPQANKAKPPLAPSVSHGRGRTRFLDDSAAYILQPDADFDRPYLAIPGTPRAFVWPLGVEGFELSGNTALGIHKYLGELELDVSVVHKDETHIRLSGIFPGWTSVENMNALRAIYDADTPERGKILHLPGILPELQYVTGENFTFTHADDDRTQDITYNISFVKSGSRPYRKGERPHKPAPVRKPPRGSGKRYYRVNSKHRSLRNIAYVLFHNSRRWTELFTLNHAFFDKNHIPSHQIPDYKLPLGFRVRY
jgi:hypothetical protein